MAIYREHPYIKKYKELNENCRALIIGTMPPPRFCKYSGLKYDGIRKNNEPVEFLQVDDQRKIYFKKENNKDIDFYYGSSDNQFWGLIFGAYKALLDNPLNQQQQSFIEGLQVKSLKDFLNNQSNDNPFRKRANMNNDQALQALHDIKHFLEFHHIGITDIVKCSNDKTYIESQLTRVKKKEYKEYIAASDDDIVIQDYNNIGEILRKNPAIERLLFTSVKARERTLEKLTKEKKEDGKLEVIKETWELSNKDKPKRTIEIITLPSPSKEKMSASDDDIVIRDDNYNNIGEILNDNTEITTLLFTSVKARERTLEKLTKEKKEDGKLEVIKETWELSNKDKPERSIDIITLTSPSRSKRMNYNTKLQEYITKMSEVIKINK